MQHVPTDHAQFEAHGYFLQQMGIFTLNTVPIVLPKFLKRPICLLSILAVTPVRIFSLEGKQYLVDVDAGVIQTNEDVLPEPLINLYDPTAASLGKEALEKLSSQLNCGYRDSYTQEAFEFVYCLFSERYSCP